MVNVAALALAAKAARRSRLRTEEAADRDAMDAACCCSTYGSSVEELGRMHAYL